MLRRRGNGFNRYTPRMRTSIRLLMVCLSSLSLLAESAAGLRWAAPAGWKAEGAQPMRAATYSIRPVTGDKAAAECAVYFFGAGLGGSVQDNLERWKGQFTGPNGKPSMAQVARRTVRGLPVTTIDTSGEYSPAWGGRWLPRAPCPVIDCLGRLSRARAAIFS